jgi:hypothetical protein
LKVTDQAKIRARKFAGILGEENVLLLQGARRGAIQKRNVDWMSHALFQRPANMKLCAFQESDEASLEAQESAGPEDRSLHELVQLSGGAELERDLEDFVQFVGLGACHTV